ncbi:hypothetical protein HF521_008260 [Silurus meridionalis]|uniref:G-protein coupled receptors family 1 profile domain-containing protein n=1 Tax=Silurus meridionalis TaxID=175797 RepID=A0A8T0AR67_SILME|nr:hypothetical protein HF521_008260 [Silurus meridionalis]
MNSNLSAALCYESLNNSCPRIVYLLSLRISFYFLFTTIIILTVSGNLLVIFVILLSQNPLPAPTNHMILSLSVAGVLIGGLVLPNSMVRSIETCWYFGQILCEIHTTVDIVLCNTTVWHLTFISVDRYLAIFHPLHYRNLMTNKTGMAMISSSWSLALVFGFVIVISNPQVKIRGVQKMNSNLSAALCYESLNNSCPRTVYPLVLHLSFYFLFTTIIVLTVSGNLLVIFVILLFQNPLATSTNHMILSLSVAGVLIGGLVLPNSMVRSIETCWYFGQMLCEIHTTVDIVLCNTTVWHLTFISVDRYLAIFHPLHYRNLMTNKTGMAMISSSWSLALVFGFVIIISNPEVKIQTKREDRDELPEQSGEAGQSHLSKEARLGRVALAKGGVWAGRAGWPQQRGETGQSCLSKEKRLSRVALVKRGV